METLIPISKNRSAVKLEARIQRQLAAKDLET